MRPPLNIYRLRLDSQEANIFRIEAQPIMNPSFLQWALGMQRDINEDLTRSITEVHRWRPRCTCPYSGQDGFHTWPPGPSASPHRPLCPFYMKEWKLASTYTRAVLCTRFLSYSVKVAFMVTIGAGGFSISPKLEFRAVVSAYSPAFTFIRHLSRSGYHRVQRNMEVPHADPVTLAQMFKDGAASPSDTLPNGMTLLHVSHTFLASR